MNQLNAFFARISRALFMIIIIVVVQSVTTEAKAQWGRDVKHDTLTQTVLIHPPVATPKGNQSVLFTREHTYRPNYAGGDQLARDFIVMSIGKDGIMRPFNPGSEGAIGLLGAAMCLLLLMGP